MRTPFSGRSCMFYTMFTDAFRTFNSRVVFFNLRVKGALEPDFIPRRLEFPRNATSSIDFNVDRMRLATPHVNTLAHQAWVLERISSISAIFDGRANELSKGRAIRINVLFAVFVKVFGIVRGATRQGMGQGMFRGLRSP